MEAQSQVQDRIYGSQLITEEERNGHRKKMGSAKTEQEQSQIRHEAMNAGKSVLSSRAKLCQMRYQQQGITGALTKDRVAARVLVATKAADPALQCTASEQQRECCLLVEWVEAVIESQIYEARHRKVFWLTYTQLFNPL
ncbi:MAG: hypothetical protein ABJM39_06190 [Porticoccus sp.]|uniref:hypothetical protein n=1 Tax=Porticoccus sp. TaxID=2024853 RepID=UPI003296CE04